LLCCCAAYPHTPFSPSTPCLACTKTPRLPSLCYGVRGRRGGVCRMSEGPAYLEGGPSEMDVETANPVVPPNSAGRPTSDRRAATERLLVTEALQRSLVQSYLLHHCYGGTAAALAAEAGGSMAGGAGWAGSAAAVTAGNGEPAAAAKTAAVAARAPILQAVLAGDVMAATAMATALEPDIFVSRRDVLFDMMCLRFVELVRAGEGTAAIVFAKKELAPFGAASSASLERLEECLALLAYRAPETSPVGQYMGADFRQGVADSLNGALLEVAGLPRRPPLEAAVRQLAAARESLAGEGLSSRFRLGEWVATQPPL